MHRLIIFGVDGGTLEIVRPLAAKGLLPNFARIMEQGVAGELGLDLPADDFPAFTTFMTGKNPGGHGVFDFFERVPGRYGVRFVNASSRRSRTLWRMLSEAGRRVAVIGFPGYLSARADQRNDGERLRRARNRRQGRSHLLLSARVLRRAARARSATTSLRRPWICAARTRSRAKESPRFCEPSNAKLETALYVMERETWDCFAFMLIESDFAGHRYWKYYDPNSPHFDADAPAELMDGLPRVYRAIDDCLGS